MHIQKITSAQLRHAINLRDLSDPAEGPHAMQLLVRDILSALETAWGCEVRIHREIPIVSVEDNYNRLHYPPDGAARDRRYTRYVCENALLRTQTSAMIPGLLQGMADGLPDDMLLACPGLVYRRDSVDRIHCAEPHHLDLWHVQNHKQLDHDDLLQMVQIVMNAALPGIAWKLADSPHPYTQGGVEINALWGDTWLEVGEAGLAHLDILRETISHRADLSGLAMGLGLDRLLMVRKNIPDIRLLRSDDPRITEQMDDLLPYRDISCMPPVVRDLSLVLDHDLHNEDLGDRVRDILGPESAIIEHVEMISETSYNDLPEAARQRLGIKTSQKNILLRVVLRALDRSLTHAECNIYRDRIYAGLHQGSEWHWAVKDGITY